MIVKTGANYQAEGGYIEFAAGLSGHITINGEKVPSSVAATSVAIGGFVPIAVRKRIDVADEIVFSNFHKTTGEGGEKFFTTVPLTIETSFLNGLVLCGFGSHLTVPDGRMPLLDSTSVDVKIVKSGSDYFIVPTGDNPKAIILTMEG